MNLITIGINNVLNQIAESVEKGQADPTEVMTAMYATSDRILKFAQRQAEQNQGRRRQRLTKQDKPVTIGGMPDTAKIVAQMKRKYVRKQKVENENQPQEQDGYPPVTIENEKTLTTA